MPKIKLGKPGSLYEGIRDFFFLFHLLCWAIVLLFIAVAVVRCSWEMTGDVVNYWRIVQ